MSIQEKESEMRANRRAVLSAAGLSALGYTVHAGAADDVEANKESARRFIDEVLNAGNMAIIDELVSPDYSPSDDRNAPGSEALKTRMESARRSDEFSVSDLAYTVDQIISIDADVFVRGYVTGVSIQGKNVKALYFIQFRFENGKVVTDWAIRDERAMVGL